jgi:hypothetical protein
MAAMVQVKGLREVQWALRKVDKDIPKGLRQELLPAARKVQDDIRSRVPMQSGKARGSVRARASQRGASIAVGGNSAPYYPWLDFGGSTGKGHKPGVSGSGSVKRDMPKGGRYLYPAIAANEDMLEKAATDAVVNLAKRAQFEVK